MFIDRVRKHVQQACLRDANIFGPAFFEEHLVVVADTAARLAICLKADCEVVELASYLHDLSAVCDPATMPTHAKASADMAACLLDDLGYPQRTISRVAEVIVSHSEALQIGSVSPEAVCLSNADVAARILRPTYWLYYAFRVRNLAFTEGRDWLRSLIEEQWQGLIEPARQLVSSQYATTIRFLSDGRCG